MKENSDCFSSAIHCYFHKLSTAENNVQELNRGKTYFCKCSKEFNEINVIKNKNSLIACQSIFIKPRKWILDRILKYAKKFNDFMPGSIEYIECKENFGQFDWFKVDLKCNCELHKGLDYCLIMKIISNKTHDS